MRDDLSDTGVIPSPGYPYNSPDIISHAQVASPKTYFKNNYNINPNQPIELGSHINFIYVRAKNLSSATKSSYYISVYRSPSSLWLTPSLWKPYKLKTQSGEDYVTLDPVNPNAIVVGNDNFILDGMATNYFCVVGVASNQKDPTLPNSFSSYSDYWNWIRNNQNICGNNLNQIRSFPNRQFERLDNFENPSDQPAPILIKLTASGPLPSGTVFGVSCAPCNISRQQTVSQGTILTASGMVPAHFNGSVKTYAELPSNGTWPAGATITTHLYVGQDADSESAQYATPHEIIGVKQRDLGEYHAKNGVLVLLGSTGTEFVS
ncbi:MAG: hypothetical protein F6K19_47330 [Cyanothece sp. SIO1E1]|nr:hypothetical protein [Cyanothece sp. SIO1E1]